MAKEEIKKNNTKRNNDVKKITSKKRTTSKKEITKIIQEENNYGKTILAAVLIIIILLGSYLAIQSKNNEGEGKETPYIQTEDEKKFQEEYESLNGTKRANGIEHQKTTIIIDNNIEYITMKEASEILNNGSGIVYFGFSACPWCRNAVPVLLEAMKNSNLEKIYYVDLRTNDDRAKDQRGYYKANEKGTKAIVEFPSEEGYKEVLKALDSFLSEYTVSGKNGKKLSTGEKRLGAPTVVAAKNGEILAFHAGTINGHIKDESGVLRELTTDEKNTLLETYTSMIFRYLDDTCPVDGETC